MKFMPKLNVEVNQNQFTLSFDDKKNPPKVQFEYGKQEKEKTTLILTVYKDPRNSNELPDSPEL